MTPQDRSLIWTLTFFERAMPVVDGTGRFTEEYTTMFASRIERFFRHVLLSPAKVRGGVFQNRVMAWVNQGGD